MKDTLDSKGFLRFTRCPTAAYYGWSGQPTGTGDDPFLTFLGQEAKTIRRLAWRLFPDGHHIGQADPVRVATLTRKHLQEGTAPVFGGCVLVDNTIAHPDVLIRKERDLHLITIKSKAGNIDAHRAGKMLVTMYGGIRACWKDYVYELAFQCAVLRQAWPDLRIVPWLLLPECNTPADAEEITSAQATPAPLPEEHDDEITRRRRRSVLKFFPASKAVDLIADEVDAAMREMKKLWRSGERPVSPLKYACRNCEFRSGNGRDETDGFHACWGKLARPRPHLFDLYQLYSLKQPGHRQALLADAKIEAGQTALFDIHEDELQGEHAARQRMQLRGLRENREIIDPRLSERIAELRWPVAFLDFETTLSAIPRHPGLKPYQTLPFQFSCHVLHADGSCEHREWLNTENRVPTLPFIRALMRALADVGSICVYTDYENRILKEALGFLATLDEDTQTERSWIFDLLHSGQIVDQHQWVYDYCFHPQMDGGRTSIKKVLPTLWKSNPSLWKHPVFRSYYRERNGVVLDPYETLPEHTFNGESFSVREGCAAMRAYREMLYGSGSSCPQTQEALAAMLRAYCKLDTLSQWIIFEHWQERLQMGSPRREHKNEVVVAAVS